MTKNIGKTNYTDPSKLINTAIDNMLSAFTSYHIWKWIQLSIHVSNERHKENLDEVINKYDYFFKQTLINTFESFVINLSIFFDKNYPNALSLPKLITAVNLNEDGKKQIETIKKPHYNTISLLKKLRDEYVAHKATGSQPLPINYENMEGLFSAVQEILGILTHKHSRSSWHWNHIESGVQRDMEWIFENLKRGEKERIRAINKD